MTSESIVYIWSGENATEDDFKYWTYFQDKIAPQIGGEYRFLTTYSHEEFLELIQLMKGDGMVAIGRGSKIFARVTIWGKNTIKKRAMLLTLFNHSSLHSITGADNIRGLPRP